MKTVAVLQPFFLPWAGVFNQIINSDTFIIGDDFQFSKNSWINRNRIKNVNGGFIWLTIPVKKSSLATPINKIEIDYTNDWVKKHLNSLRTIYSKSSFFEDFYYPIEEILNKKHRLLFDLNLELLQYICNILEIKTEFKLRSSYNLNSDKNISLLEICKNEKATIYLTGPKAQNYLDENLFEENNIRVVYQDFHYSAYKQIGEDLVDKLSIIDMLFMIGKSETNAIIRKEI